MFYEEVRVDDQHRVAVITISQGTTKPYVVRHHGRERSARNPLIVEVLRDYGYVDARGMGVRNKIIPLLRQQNGVEPEFKATMDYLKITMPRGRSART